MTQLEIINFLNGFNPTSATLTTEQLGTLTTQLRDIIPGSGLAKSHDAHSVLKDDI